MIPLEKAQGVAAELVKAISYQTTEYKRFRARYDARARQLLWERDKVCIACGKTQEQAKGEAQRWGRSKWRHQVAHLIGVLHGLKHGMTWDELYSPRNICLLCYSCHGIYDGRVGMAPKDESIVPRIKQCSAYMRHILKTVAARVAREIRGQQQIPPDDEDEAQIWGIAESVARLNLTPEEEREYQRAREEMVELIAEGKRETLERRQLIKGKIKDYLSALALKASQGDKEE